MAWPSTPRIRLTRRQRRELARLAARTSAAHALVQRARMVLRLASGQWPATVARALGVTDRCVRKWRARWLLARDVRGLEDADRPGRPARISVAVKCELVEMACDREKGVAFREVWTQQSLADALLVRRGISVSRSTVQRTLHARGMRPHRIRQWLHSPDPEFRRKVQRVCEIVSGAAAGLDRALHRREADAGALPALPDSHLDDRRQPAPRVRVRAAWHLHSSRSAGGR